MNLNGEWKLYYYDNLSEPIETLEALKAKTPGVYPRKCRVMLNSTYHAQGFCPKICTLPKT